jgi:nucleoid-associated protein YgaU
MDLVDKLNRPLIIAAIGVLVVVLAIGLNYLSKQQPKTPDEVASGESRVTAGSASSEPTTAQSVQPPTFDVVRVGPLGDAVIAGRAEPGSTVVIMEGDKSIGEATADERGEWVFVPETPLPPGTRRFGLEMRVEGRPPVLSDKLVEMILPERGKDIAGRPTTAATQALVRKVPRRGFGPTQVMQMPSQEGGVLALSIDVIDYDDAGHLSIGGKAPLESTVQLYLNNDLLGRAVTGPDGRWRITPERGVEPNVYTLRADQIDAQGNVVARVATPFARSKPLAGLGEDTVVVVQPGNSLWWIARNTYGSGPAYTVIYEANRDQIKDPDLIYPGQVFALPETD